LPILLLVVEEEREDLLLNMLERREAEWQGRLY
jgi:hypothetical protein